MNSPPPTAAATRGEMCPDEETGRTLLRSSRGTTAGSEARRSRVEEAALVLVFDKHCAGEVASPGGYLRGMVEKAGAGELHLERSFYGRLNGQAA
jgi:hypothetical protein